MRRSIAALATAALFLIIATGSVAATYPTPEPSWEPSATPTTEPSGTPTATPTATPSSTPTAEPTPSDTPTPSSPPTPSTPPIATPGVTLPPTDTEPERGAVILGRSTGELMAFVLLVIVLGVSIASTAVATIRRLR